MGVYAILYFGDFHVAAFKSDITLESLLMFTQEDLKLGTEESEGEVFKTAKFITTAGEARHRLDSRGVDLYLCRSLFDQFRADEIREFVFSEETHSVSSKYVSNPFDFDLYLKTLSRIYHEKPDRRFPLHNSTGSLEWKDDKEAFLISSGDVFDSDASTYYGDALFIVFARSFLETIPSDELVTLDVSDLLDQEYINETELSDIFDFYMNLVLRRIELDYKIYGFVLEDDPSLVERLRTKIAQLNEDQFLDHVVFPLLGKMGYERVRKVRFHGPSEFGSDILPFRHTTPLGTYEYYAVQAKAVSIHGTSAKPGNAAELISQATQAFAVTFVDDIDNERKRLDKFIIVTNKAISADARRFIEEAVEGKRRLIFLDIDKIVDLVKKHNLLQYVLFNDLQ